MSGEAEIVVATNAFGMGVDKADIRSVIHFNMPGTLEAYYQEAGRAGRDGEPAHCVLLHAYRDRFTHEWFIRGMYPDRVSVERVYDQLCLLHKGPGGILPPAGKQAESAVRLLLQEGVLAQQVPTAHRLHVRLLATPARITRELAGTADEADLRFLRDLWRLGGPNLRDGTTLRLDALSPPMRGRQARAALDRLRSRQFLDFVALDDGLLLVRPEAALDTFGIDWDAFARRRAADLEKLEMMQRYAYVKTCRRAFLLRYFGEQRTNGRCASCDTCVASRLAPR